MKREDKVAVGVVAKKATADRSKSKPARDYDFPEDSMLTALARAFHNPNAASKIIGHYLNCKLSR